MRAREDELLAELEQLYTRADTLYAGATCGMSTECCRFGITGREPQVTSIELALVRRALSARGGGLPKKRALPLARPGVRDERTCPLLAPSGRCAIYAARPLGCRTFFCDRADVPAPPSRAALKELVRDLQELASRHAPQGDKARAFTAALQSER
ncbi:MAG: YkgJ family cysteine cluster protein [Myxococcales bacterium]